MEEKDDRPQPNTQHPLQQADKPPRPSSLNRWAQKNKVVAETKTQEIIEYSQPPTHNPESKKIFTPKLLGTEETTYANIQAQVRGNQLLKELEDSAIAFQTRLRLVLQEADTIHQQVPSGIMQLEKKYREKTESRSYQQPLRQLNNIRHQTTELSSSMLMSMDSLCRV